MTEQIPTSIPPKKLVGLIAGPVVFLLLMLGTGIEGLTPEGQAAAAVTLLMAIWWLSEALPIYVTALVPIVLFPITGVLTTQATTQNYGHELIFLFLGGFLVAAAIEKWGLHRRIALTIVRLFGVEPARLVLGFMVATGFLSMWISNTASAMMMVPIGLAVIGQLSELLHESDPELDLRPGHFPFGSALMLGIAYSASLGGITTITASPPNAIFVAFFSQLYGVEITYLQWMLFGLPFAAVGIAAVWFYLTRIAFKIDLGEFPGLKELIDEQTRELGPIKGPEGRVLFVFGLVSSLWVVRGAVAPFLHHVGLGGLTDTSIAMLGGILLFIIPAHLGRNEQLLNWDDVQRIPWGILILFGGGLALATGIESSGLGGWLGQQLQTLQSAPALLVVVLVVLIMSFLTEITSNTSSATIFVPIAAILATAIGLEPYILMVGVVLAASCAFMLPISTPPNAVVFSTKYITMGQMVRAGIWLNLSFSVFITLAVYFALPLIWRF